MPSVGSFWIIDGVRYRYTGGKGYNFVVDNGRGGIGGVIQIHFLVNPFLGTYAEARGVPMPFWASMREAASSTPIVSSMLVDQQRICRVGVYLPMNSSIDVDLFDDDFIPFLDPNDVPMIVQRRNAASDATDRVGAYSSDTPDWFDLGIGQRPISEVTNQLMISCELRRENEPIPHWVANIGCYYNGAAGNNVTIITDFIGQYSGPHSALFREDGATGDDYHYKVELIHPLQNYRSNSALATATSRLFGREGSYIAPSATATLWLTDTGLSGGANLFDATFPPTVWIGGAISLSVNPATEGDFQISSRGMGYANISGVLSDGVTSIQNQPDFQAYSVLDRSGGKWRVQITNFSSSDRHFCAFSCGKTP